MGGGDYAEIVQWRDKVMQRVAAENPRILNLESDYLERQPRVIVQIDRNKAADLGVSLQTVGRTLETMLGSRIVTTFERARRGIRRRPAGARRAARLGRRSRQSVRALRQERRPDAAVGAGAHRRARRAHGAAAHRSHARHRARRFAGAGLHARRGGGVHGAGDPRGSAERADHLQRRDLPAQEIRRRVVDHVRVRAAGRLPGARGAVRELHPPHRDPGDRAAGASRARCSACSCSIPPSTSSARSAASC